MTRRVILALVASVVAASAQPERPATNIAALLAFPAYFHLRPVTIVATITMRDDGQLVVSDGIGSLPLIAKAGTSEGPSEVRGELWDLGRLTPNDPRLASVDVKQVFHVDPEGSVWPRPGEALGLMATAIAAATPPSAPSIRAIVLNTTRYLDRKLTIVGQFEGRNLGGHLPNAPGLSPDDFVLRAGDAAVWVTGVRPRGHGFNLSVDRRIDTGRWLEVSGTVRQGRGLIWLEAEPGSLKLGLPPAATVVDQKFALPPGPPPEVIFSTPMAEEVDVPTRTNVRIQFSRDVDATTLKDRVRVQYADAAGTIDAPRAAPIEFSTNYVAADRVMAITFAKGLERLRTVRVDFLEGVLGTDAQPLQPWSLTFETGGE